MSQDLMTVSEAERIGYSVNLMHCGPNSSGSIIRMSKWDKTLNCIQFTDAKPDAVDKLSAPGK